MSIVKDRRHSNSHIMAFKLSEDLRERIKERSKRREVTEGELIRNAIEMYLRETKHIL